MHHGGQTGPESEESPNTTWRGLAEPSSSVAPATIESTGSNSGGNSSSLPDSTLPSSSTSEDGRVQILKRLEKEVESFRNNQVSKTATIASIIRVLEESDVEITPSQKESTITSYLTEILSIESARDIAQDVEAPDEGSSFRPTHQPSIKEKSKSRSFKETAGSDSDSEDDKPSKRPKLIESKLPWFEPIIESTSDTSNPSCQETCRLLRIYNVDIKKAKFLVKIAPKSPSGIPSSQWERILKGESVDLNQIFSSLHHVVVDEERTGRMGETEISFGVSEPKKRISTASEWSTAWRKASKAITFAFPHRREELLEYGDYLDYEFAAKLPSIHHKLFLYDLALRNEVAGGQRALLTDHSKFSRLYSAIVLPDGVEGNSEGTTSRKPSK
jgi:hypothetical protein